MTSRPEVWLAPLLTAAALAGCRQDMHDQPRLHPYDESPLVPGTSAAFPTPAGTVARGALAADTLLPAGDLIPIPVTAQTMARGRERFGIYCVPCHGHTGRGDGPVIQRGFFPRIANLQDERLRQAPASHIFGVITNGYNAMPDYGGSVAPADRWAIVAYVRALQYSEHAAIDDVPAAARSALGGTP